MLEVSNNNLNANVQSSVRASNDGAAQNVRQNASNASRQVIANKQNSNDGVQNVGEKLTQVTQKLNEQMTELDTNVRFGFNDELGTMYITVTEKNTGRVIRQIPSEEAMKLMEHFKSAIGLLYDKEN